MSSDHQISANRANAQHSTGPRTGPGKATSSRNALTLGLFTMRDFVRPEENAEYDQLCNAFWRDLNPQDALEQTFVTAIVGATWRMRRCSLVESELATIFSHDPMLPHNSNDDEAGQRTQTSVDRARAQAFSILRRATTELRRLKADRAKAPKLMRSQPVIPFSSPSLGLNCNPPAPTPRNASCPCGSGDKYKRCCGKQAAPVLGRAA
jgi:hypothetical protein